MRIANALYEALYRLRAPGRHKDVIAFVIRFTYGYQKARDTIAVSQIADGTMIDERGIRRIISDLVNWNVLGRKKMGPGRPAALWVVKDFETWSVDQTSQAKRMKSTKPRVSAPGSTRPGEDAAPGEAARARMTQTPGEEHPSTPGEHAPLQRQKDNTKDSVGADAPPPHTEPDISRLKNFIQKGSIPKGLDGETWPTRDAWFEHHTPKIIAEAEGRAKERAMRAGNIERWSEFFSGEAKKLVIAYWNRKTPRVTTTKRRTQTLGVGQWQNG